LAIGTGDEAGSALATMLLSAVSDVFDAVVSLNDVRTL
jgi:hypothetical protein